MNLTIQTKFLPATSRYTSAGCCEHLPAVAMAWDSKRGSDVGVEITGAMFPNLDQNQLVAKAVAMLRNRGRR